MLVIKVTPTILVGLFTEVIKSEGVVTSLCAVTKVSRNARNLLPQFLAELGDDGVRKDQRKLG
jgi:hypothetical protein